MGYTLNLGQSAPNFTLKGTDGQTYTLDSFKKAKGVVIFFTCNHCPYVIGSNENTKELAQKFQNENIQFVGINSNSPNTYPEDSFEHMIQVMDKEQYPWTYLYDADQSIASAYGGLKTPHFFFFNEERELIYTGRAVDKPRDATLATTHELQDAIEDFLKGEPVQTAITNPIGCNIKWEGKPPHWMPPEACDLT